MISRMAARCSPYNSRKHRTKLWHLRLERANAISKELYSHGDVFSQSDFTLRKQRSRVCDNDDSLLTLPYSAVVKEGICITAFHSQFVPTSQELRGLNRLSVFCVFFSRLGVT